MEIRKITPVDKHIAKKLKQFRRAAGMSQDKLGELTGISFQQIQKYERAHNRISSGKLFEFSQLLKQPISAFFRDLASDQRYYQYNFKTEKQILRNLEKTDGELLPLIRAFKHIENNQTRKYLSSLIISIAKPRNKRIKHWYGNNAKTMEPPKNHLSR